MKSDLEPVRDSGRERAGRGIAFWGSFAALVGCLWVEEGYRVVFWYGFSVTSAMIGGWVASRGEGDLGWEFTLPWVVGETLIGAVLEY